MTCPACDCKLSVERESCENCGAPTYLATARQSSELIHCPACGTRGQAGSGLCFTCGGKKSFQANEKAAGLCRNCGATWGKTWFYCQRCGVARENGLVEMIMPSSPLPVVGVSSQHRHSFNAAEVFVPESFITERQDASFPAYFAHNDEAVRHQSEEDEAESTVSPVTQTAAGPATAITSATVGSQNFAPPRVQAASVKHKSPVRLKQPLTKHYLTLILVLVGVILVFSALSGFGISPEDLFGRLWLN